MNIYFVNRRSKLKGPYDIIDSHRKKIIKVGDICLHDCDEGMSFLIVVGLENSWNACKRVGVGDHGAFSGIGNTLVFSFDGLHKRYGNVALIKQLQECFIEKTIVDFFNNAIDIILYKTDFWDASLLGQLYSTCNNSINQDVIKPSVIQTTGDYPSVFAKYLDETLMNLLTQCLDEGYVLKDAYKLLREKEPGLFRVALLEYLAENPNGTIYD